MKYINLFLIAFAFTISMAHGQQKIDKLISKEITVNGKVSVNSTTMSSKPCPVMTEAQRNAISSPENGSCVYNSNSLSLNVWNGSTWGSVGGGLSGWVTSFAYSIGDVVIESNKIYKCLIAHTSGTFATDLIAGDWVELSATPIINLASDVSGILPILNGGTGSSTQNFVDLTTNQAVAGNKLLSGSTILGDPGSESTGIDISGTNYQSTFKVSDINGTNYAQSILHRHSTLLEPLILGARSNSDTSSHGNIAAGQNLFTIYGSGWETNNYKLFGSMSIAASSLGTLSSTSAPGKILFNTTPNGSQTPTAHLTLDSDKSSTFTGSVSATSLAIGGALNANAIADFKSGGVKGFLPPLMTTAQKIAYGATLNNTTDKGMIVHDTDINSLSSWNGTQWIAAVGNLVLDHEYSAQVSATGVVSGENVDWISSCTWASAGVGYCNFNAGKFTVAPNCTATIYVDDSSTYAGNTIFSTTKDYTYFRTQASPSGSVSRALSLHCSKTGADYVSSTFLTGASANTSWVPCTFPDLTATSWGGLASTGSITNNSLQCQKSGSYLEMKGSFTTGTVGPSLAKIPLPTNYGTIVTQTSGLDSYGLIHRNIGDVTATANLIGTVGLGYMNISGSLASTNNPNTPSNGNGYANSAEVQTLKIVRIPIAGWSNVSQTIALAMGSGAVTASTSGTSIDYVIPPGVKRITMLLSGVSTNGTSQRIIRIGSGSIATTGYACNTADLVHTGSVVATTSTSGFTLSAGSASTASAASLHDGIIQLTLLGNNIWAFSSNAGLSNAAISIVASGSKALSGVLDTIRLTTVNGTDAFDAGSVNVIWEY